MYAHTCMQTMRMGVGGCRSPIEITRPSRAYNKQSGEPLPLPCLENTAHLIARK